MELQPVTVSVMDAVRLTGLSMRSVYRALDNGDLESVKVGRRRLVTYASIQKLAGSK